MNTPIEPPPDWYINCCARIVAQGGNPSLLPIAERAEAAPSNVISSPKPALANGCSNTCAGEVDYDPAALAGRRTPTIGGGVRLHTS
jgi:hypothetical protein